VFEVVHRPPGAGPLEPALNDDQIVKQWGFIRSYLIKDGHLFLSLMADGGVYEFEPIDAANPGSSVPLR